MADSVAEPELDATRPSSLGRNAGEHEPVVVPPVAAGGHERLGVDPPVGVRRRVEEGHQRGPVLDQPGDEVAAQRREPVAPLGVDERVLTVATSQRRVEMEARALVVVPRLADEGREQALEGGELLDRALEAERAVGRLERVAVVEVDLELAAAVLVVPGERAEPEIVDAAQEAWQHPARVACGPGRVDAARNVLVASEAPRR